MGMPAKKRALAGVHSASSAAAAERAWLATLPKDVRRSVPNQVGTCDGRARKAELARLQSEGVLDANGDAHVAADRLLNAMAEGIGQKARARREDERLRDRSRSRPFRKPPSGVAFVGLVIEPASATTRSIMRLATGDEFPDLVLPNVIRAAPLQESRALIQSEAEQLRRVRDALDLALEQGSATRALLEGAELAHIRIFGGPFRDAWIDVVLEAIENAAKARIRLARDPSVDHRKHGRTVYRNTEATAGAAIRRALYNLAREAPGIELPAHVAEEALEPLIERFGFDGNGGRAGKLARATVRALLANPADLKRLRAAETTTHLRGSTQPRRPRK